MQYSKIIYPIVALFAILMVSSCNDDTDELEVREDGKVHVGVGVNMANTVEVTTRAAEGYQDFGGSIYNGWTMGVYAIGTSVIEQGSATYTWTSETIKGWSSDLWMSPATYSFYSYIPYNNEATSVKMITENSQAKLSISGQPAFGKTDLLASVAAGTESTLTDGSFAAAVSDSKSTTVNFRMNHLLSKLNLKFALPTDVQKYDDLRRIEIKSVTLSSDLASSKSFNISFDYKGARTPVFTAAATNQSDKAKITLDYSTKDADGKAVTSLMLSQETPGPSIYYFDEGKSDLYIVPNIVNQNGQKLSLSITYNVYTKNKEGDAYVLTRENATATNNNIVVYKNNGAKDVEAGKYYTITVNVVPSYLYMLADIDQSSSIVLQ